MVYSIKERVEIVRWYHKTLICNNATYMQVVELILKFTETYQLSTEDTKHMGS